jgi:hypothetical protein
MDGQGVGAQCSLLFQVSLSLGRIAHTRLPLEIGARVSIPQALSETNSIQSLHHLFTFVV